MRYQGVPVELLLLLKSLSSKKYVGLFFRPFYRIYNLFLGIDIPWSVKIGRNLKISHPVGIVINANAIIGDDCVIRQNTTIGSKNGFAPIIHNKVDIGCNSVILGGITIEDNVIIGGGSVVVKSVEKNSVIAGNPAKIIKRINP